MVQTRMSPHQLMFPGGIPSALDRDDEKKREETVSHAPPPHYLYPTKLSSSKENKPTHQTGEWDRHRLLLKPEAWKGSAVCQFKIKLPRPSLKRLGNLRESKVSMTGHMFGQASGTSGH